MKLFKLIKDLLEAELRLCTEKAKEYELLHGNDAWNIEAGRVIEEISNQYPASYQDAAIIFEEWCKGLLSESRPSEDMLRGYAKFTSSSDMFRLWICNRENKILNGMRHLTEEEQEDYQNVIEKRFSPTGGNFYDNL